MQYPEITLKFFTLPARDDFNASEALNDYLSAHFSDIICSDCNSRKIEVFRVISLPKNLVIQIGRIQSNTITGGDDLNKIPIKYSKDLNVVMGSGIEHNFEFFSAIGFEGIENNGHFYNITPAVSLTNRKDNPILIASGSTCNEVLRKSKKFGQIEKEVCYLVFQQKSKEDASLKFELEYAMPYFKEMNSKLCPSKLKALSDELETQCAFAAIHLNDDLNLGNFASFFKRIREFDRYEYKTLGISVECRFQCLECVKVYNSEGNFNLRVLELFPYNEFMDECKKFLHNEIKEDGCIHCLTECVTQVVYIPDSVVIYTKLKSVEQILSKLNLLNDDYSEINNGAKGERYFIKCVYAIKQKQFFTYANNQFTESASRQDISSRNVNELEKNDNIYVLKRCHRDVSIVSGVSYATKSSNSLSKISNPGYVALHQTSDLPAYIEIGKNFIFEPEIRQILDCQSNLSDRVVNAFFLKLPSVFSLDHFSFIGGDDTYGTSLFNTPTVCDLEIDNYEPSKKSALHRKMEPVVVGALLENGQHWVIYFYEWKKEYLTVYDPYGPMKPVTIRKIHNLVCVWAFRKGLSISMMAIHDLGMADIFKMNSNDTSNSGVFCCAVALKLLSGSSSEAWEGVPSFRWLIHATICQQG